MSPVDDRPADSTALAYGRALLAADSVSELLLGFLRALRVAVEIDGVRFEPGNGAEPVAFGRLRAPRSRHRLRWGEEMLGTLWLYRSDEFQAAELRLVEDHLALLLPALRNHYRLHAALAAARRDPLTQLPNRAAYNEAVGAELALARRHDSPLALVVIDIDHFKRVNDEQGHQAGDRVLNRVAETLRRALRSSDLLFRYGGEEFVVLLRHTDGEGARAWAERARLALAGLRPHLGGQDYEITASLGVAGVDGGQVSAEALFGRADAALYRAKHGGRNRVELAP